MFPFPSSKKVLYHSTLWLMVGHTFAPNGPPYPPKNVLNPIFSNIYDITKIIGTSSCCMLHCCSCIVVHTLVLVAANIFFIN